MNRFSDLGPWWLTAAIGLLDLFAIARALVRGHGVTSTLAWICGVIAFPGVGALAYLLLANPSVRRTVRRRAAASISVDSAGLVEHLVAPDERRLATLATELTGITPSSGNRVKLLVEEDLAFERIEAALAQARDTIWAEYYIVRNDETGHRFLDLLADRARAGVRVLLLYDAVGSMGLDGARLQAIRAAGGRVEPFLPLNPLRRRWAVHLRNHRKLIVVDGRVAFTGGMNVGDEYSGRSKLKGGQHFRDTHLSIEGPAVRHYAELFTEDWKFATDEAIAIADRSSIEPGSSFVCPLPSGPDQSLNASAHVFFAGIMTARRHCFITTPYFVPDEPTIRALVTAAQSGVDVRILVPSRCDVRVVGAAARSFYRELVRGGVRIFEYQPSMLHAKCMVVDNRWGLVGSANVDMRSFRLNFEIGALVMDESFAELMARRFLDDLDASTEVTRESLLRVGMHHQLVQGTARLLSPIL